MGRLKDAVPTGVLNATIEQLGLKAKGIESTHDSRIAAVVKKLQEAGTSIDLS